MSNIFSKTHLVHRHTQKKDKQHRHTRKKKINTDIRENRTIEKNMLGNTNKKGNGDFAIFRFPLESTARFII